MSVADSSLLTVEQAAELLTLSSSTLNKRRTTGGGPPFVKLGRSVRYRLADVTAWLESRVRASTSEPGAPRAT